MINPFAMLKDFSGAADAVLRGMKPTPGGDAFIYTGSMNAVEALRDALSAFHDWEMNCALESEDGVADCPQDDGCCHKTRLRGAPCPLGLKCPFT